MSTLQLLEVNQENKELFKGLKDKNKSEEPNKKLSVAKLRVGKKNPMYGKRHKEETLAKMRESKLRVVYSQEHCDNISRSLKGKLKSEEHKIKLGKVHLNNKNWQGKTHKEESKLKISSALKGKKRSESHCKNLSLALRLSLIKKLRHENVNVYPNCNLDACYYFYLFDSFHNTKGKYAMFGGGEYCIKELGYWPDYINFDLKLIMEWDESHHFDKSGNLCERDIVRQKEIQEMFPDFEFKRIREI